MAVSLPLVILLYDGIFNPPLKFKSRYLGYFSVLFFYLWVRFFLMRNPTEPMFAYPGGSFLYGHPYNVQGSGGLFKIAFAAY